MTTLQEITQKEFDEIVLDYCYDRYICRLVGANYNRMNGTDINKVKKYVLGFYAIKEEEIKINKKRIW